MATKRLIDANDLWTDIMMLPHNGDIISSDEVEQAIKEAPTVDAVEVEKYNALLEMYHELRENFIDYYCSGSINVAPYCLNKCEECVDKWGYCKQYSDYCKGFNPAEVILDGAKMDGDGNED